MKACRECGGVGSHATGFRCEDCAGTGEELTYEQVDSAQARHAMFVRGRAKNKPDVILSDGSVCEHYPNENGSTDLYRKPGTGPAVVEWTDERWREYYRIVTNAV